MQGSERNMFFQWMEFTAFNIVACYASGHTCITCYNVKQTPQITPLPGFTISDCGEFDTNDCLSKCTLEMVAGCSNWSADPTICPKALKHELESWLLPRVEGLVFPFYKQTDGKMTLIEPKKILGYSVRKEDGSRN